MHKNTETSMFFAFLTVRKILSGISGDKKRMGLKLTKRKNVNNIFNYIL